MRCLVLCAVLVVCAVLAVPAEFIVDLGISWNRAVVEPHFTQESTTQNYITKKKIRLRLGAVQVLLAEADWSYELLSSSTLCTFLFLGACVAKTR